MENNKAELPKVFENVNKFKYKTYTVNFGGNDYILELDNKIVKDYCDDIIGLKGCSNPIEIASRLFYVYSKKNMPMMSQKNARRIIEEALDEEYDIVKFGEVLADDFIEAYNTVFIYRAKKNAFTVGN